MSRFRPVVVHPAADLASPATVGNGPRHLYDSDGRWVGWTGWIQNDAGDVSSWHHHGGNDTYVYVSRGSVTLEFGPGGSKRVSASAGDFFLVPAQTIHRETTSPDSDLDALILRVGGEPEHVNVDGPEPADGNEGF